MRIPRPGERGVGYQTLTPQAPSMPQTFNPGEYVGGAIQQIGNQAANLAIREKEIFRDQEIRNKTVSALSDFSDRIRKTDRELREIYRGSQYQEQAQLFFDSHLEEIRQELDPDVWDQVNPLLQQRRISYLDNVDAISFEHITEDARATVLQAQESFLQDAVEETRRNGFGKSVLDIIAEGQAVLDYNENAYSPEEIVKLGKRYYSSVMKEVLFAAVERDGAQAVLNSLENYPLEPTQRTWAEGYLKEKIDAELTEAEQKEREQQRLLDDSYDRHFTQMRFDMGTNPTPSQLADFRAEVEYAFQSGYSASAARTHLGWADAQLSEHIRMQEMENRIVSALDAGRILTRDQSDFLYEKNPPKTYDEQKAFITKHLHIPSAVEDDMTRSVASADTKRVLEYGAMIEDLMNTPEGVQALGDIDSKTLEFIQAYYSRVGNAADKDLAGIFQDTYKTVYGLDEKERQLYEDIYNRPGGWRDRFREDIAEIFTNKITSRFWQSVFGGDAYTARKFSGDEIGQPPISAAPLPPTPEMVQFMEDQMLSKAGQIRSEAQYKNALRQTLVELRKQWQQTSFNPSGWMKYAPESIAPDTGVLRKILDEDLMQYGYRILPDRFTPSYTVGDGLTPLESLSAPVRDQRQFLPEIIMYYVDHDDEGYPQYLIILPNGETLLDSDTNKPLIWGGKDTFDKYESLIKEKAQKREQKQAQKQKYERETFSQPMIMPAQ